MKVRINVARVQDAKAIESLLKLKERAYTLYFTPNAPFPYRIELWAGEGLQAFEHMIEKHLLRYKHNQERAIHGVKIEAC